MSLFFRGGPHLNQPLGDNVVPGYGSTNQAFNPDAPGSIDSGSAELFAASDNKNVTNVGNSSFLGADNDDNSQSSADTEVADQRGNGNGGAAAGQK